MYLIIDKTTRAILHMSNANAGPDLKPADLLPGFDPETMVFGRAAEDHVPVHFDIQDGVVVNLDPAAAMAAAQKAPEAVETLAQARVRKKNEWTGQALALRAELVPDYQLFNAGLGIYDDARTASLKATVNAFRDEVNRLEGELAKAKSQHDIDALTPNFPSALVAAPKAPPAAARPAKPK